jgi:hypothetical protein
MRDTSGGAFGEDGRVAASMECGRWKNLNGSDFWACALGGPGNTTLRHAA